MTTTMILRANAGGQAMAWISWQAAVLLYARDQVMWTVGDQPLRFRGGVNRLSGQRSYRDVHPVIAAKGRVVTHAYSVSPPLTNRELFRRDRHTCLYCLTQLTDRHLTRDHVIPVSRGGEDIWSNVVAACRFCNQKKANRTPKEAGMHLHAVPYVPSYAEWLILRNRRLFADQMTFLLAQCPKRSRLRN